MAEHRSKSTAAAPFERESRYIVIKRSHFGNDANLNQERERSLLDYLEANSIQPVSGVFVEDNWPEYETVWQMIEARCAGGAK